MTTSTQCNLPLYLCAAEGAGLFPSSFLLTLFLGATCSQVFTYIRFLAVCFHFGSKCFHTMLLFLLHCNLHVTADHRTITHSRAGRRKREEEEETSARIRGAVFVQTRLLFDEMGAVH